MVLQILTGVLLLVSILATVGLGFVGVFVWRNRRVLVPAACRIAQLIELAESEAVQMEAARLAALQRGTGENQ